MVKVLEDYFPVGTYSGQKTSGLYMDGALYHNIQFIKKAVLKYKQLKVIAIVGDPGCGKSTFYTQLAKVIDPEGFNLGNCHFSVDEWAKAVGDKPQDAPLSIEANDEFSNVSSRSYNSKTNKKQLMILARMRSKKIIVFFMLPSFFELDRMIAMFYCDMIIKCYNHKQIHKGFFECWIGKENIRRLYLSGKRDYNYFYVKPNFHGRFVDCFCLPEQEYEQKKQKALSDVTNQGENSVSRKEVRFFNERNRLISNLYATGSYTQGKIADMVGLDESQVNRILSKTTKKPLDFEEKCENVGTNI